VEIKQVRNVITLSINRTPVLVYTNTTVWTNGYLMLGYADPYGGTGGLSVGKVDAAVYYANLNVVRLSDPVIGTIAAPSGGNVALSFTTTDGSDTPNSFALLSSPTLSGSFTNVGAAAIFSSLGNGKYQVTAPPSGAQQFYRLLRK
jgi:hypothetical protein